MGLAPTLRTPPSTEAEAPLHPLAPHFGYSAPTHTPLGQLQGVKGHKVAGGPARRPLSMHNALASVPSIT